VTPATITDDLRRRDFTVNAMALSLNEGSRGLLMDPFNGAADIENKLLRVIQNYAFLEDPSRLIRATRFAARFHGPLEERTQQRYDSAKENNYITLLSCPGHETEQLPTKTTRSTSSRSSRRKVGSKYSIRMGSGEGRFEWTAQLMKTRQQMNSWLHARSGSRSHFSHSGRQRHR
jgi:hypothetical protein